MKYNKLLSRAHRMRAGAPALDERRCSGRSTAIMLGLIADAINSPGDWLDVVDHYDGGFSRNMAVADALFRTVKVLGLNYFERRITGVGVTTTEPGVQIRCNSFTDNPWEIE